MKQKRNKAYYLQRAVDGFKTLIIYQCVTKPQFDPVYKDENGKFSKDKMIEESAFLDNWNRLSKKRRNYHIKHHTEYFKQYKKHSTHHNLAFGLDCKLVEQILGCYRDDDGKKVRITIEEVLQNLDGWYKCSNRGKTIRKDANGTPRAVCWWKKKYFIADEEEWISLLSNPMYSNLDKYPRATDGESLAIEQIWKYRKQTIGKHYPDLRGLFAEFFTGKISEIAFSEAARWQFKLTNEEIQAVISRKRGMTNGNPETKENKTRTHYQDKQGQEVSDETPSPAESSNNSAPSGQGEKPICLGGSIQEAQGLQKTAN